LPTLAERRGIAATAEDNAAVAGLVAAEVVAGPVVEAAGREVEAVAEVEAAQAEVSGVPKNRTWTVRRFWNECPRRQAGAFLR
jgi:hypothetical protein